MEDSNNAVSISLASPWSDSITIKKKILFLSISLFIIVLMLSRVAIMLPSMILYIMHEKDPQLSLIITHYAPWFTLILVSLIAIIFRYKIIICMFMISIYVGYFIYEFMSKALIYGEIPFAGKIFILAWFLIAVYLLILNIKLRQRSNI